MPKRGLFHYSTNTNNHFCDFRGLTLFSITLRGRSSRCASKILTCSETDGLVRGAVTAVGVPDCLPWQFWLGDTDLLAATAPRGLPDGLVVVPASPAPFRASLSSDAAISLLSMMACAIVKTGETVVRLDFDLFLRC